MQTLRTLHFKRQDLSLQQSSLVANTEYNRDTSSAVNQSSLLGRQKSTLTGILRLRGVASCIETTVDTGHGLLYLLDVDNLRRVRSVVSVSGKWPQNYDLDLFRASSITLHCCRVLEAGAEVIATFEISVTTLKSHSAYELQKVGERVTFQTPWSNGIAMKLKLQIQTVSRSPARVARHGQRGLLRLRYNANGEFCNDPYIPNNAPSELSPAFGVALQQVPATSKGRIPMVLVACITELEKRGLHEPELYLLSGEVSVSRQLRMCAGTPDSIAFLDLLRRLSSYDISSAIKRFLEQLPEPVFSVELATVLSASSFRRMLSEIRNTDDAAQIILKKVLLLDQPNKTTVLFLLDHFRRVVKNSALNGCTEDVLAAVLAHLLLAERVVPGVPTDEDVIDWHVEVTRLIFMCSQMPGIVLLARSGAATNQLIQPLYP